jgi:rfaE bifunctional protein nucleotidyltransferase chain/domain/rfaE bifunctional protein kinase chain/domain
MTVVPAGGGPVGRFAGRRVLVIGDVMLDGWLTGRPTRICRDGPVPVVELAQSRYCGGGAANTAVNVAALGGTATLVAAVGEDGAADRLGAELAVAGVTARLVPVPRRRTPVKSRLLADGQVVARVDEGDTGELPGPSAGELIRLATAALIAGCDALVVCDYGAGTLAGPVRAWLEQIRPRLRRFIVDAHDPRRWAGLHPDLMTPNFDEALGALGDPPAPSVRRAQWLADRAGELFRALPADLLAVTLDAEGALLIEGGVPTVRTRTHSVPVAQTTGAGDCYVAAFTLALTAGVAAVEAAELAQRAAEIAVCGTGTAVCTADELDAAVDARTGVVDAGGLARLVAGHRRHGRRVVFTNGCFDVLHRGHVGYLAEAARLGDVLVVAVNSDESVRRLKGDGRPVNPVEDRAAVLAALASVDHVVVFDEDSPRNLINLVRPDLYVKGGDYPPELIPEADLVHRLGGEVRTMAYLPDRSTSQIIHRIRSR